MQSRSRCNFCAVESKIVEPNNYGAHNEIPKAEIDKNISDILGKEENKENRSALRGKGFALLTWSRKRSRNMIANKNNRKFEEQALEV